MDTRTHRRPVLNPMTSRYGRDCEHSAAPLNSTTRAAFEGKRLVGVDVVKMYLTLRHRNAWNGTTSLQYKGKSALEANLAEAGHTAEDWRAMGSSFQIREEPALAFSFTDAVLVVAETHATDPFHAWGTGKGADASEHLRPGLGLQELLDIVDAGWPPGLRPAENSKKTVVVADPRSQDALSRLETASRDSRFTMHVSVAPSGGSSHPMAWRARPWTRRSDGANRVADLFRDHRQPGYAPSSPFISPRAAARARLAARKTRHLSVAPSGPVCTDCFQALSPSGACGCSA